MVWLLLKKKFVATEKRDSQSKQIRLHVTLEFCALKLRPLESSTQKGAPRYRPSKGKQGVRKEHLLDFSYLILFTHFKFKLILVLMATKTSKDAVSSDSVASQAKIHDLFMGSLDESYEVSIEHPICFPLN